MAMNRLQHQSYLGFDQATYDRINRSTITSDGKELDALSDEDPSRAFRQLHTVLGRDDSLTMQSIYVRTHRWETSIADDGYDAARAIMLGEIEEGMMGGTYIYPAHVLLLVTAPVGARGILASKSTRRQLAQPRPVVDISLEPPSFAH